MGHILEYLLALALFSLLVYVPGYLITETLLRRRIAGPALICTRATLGLGFWIATVFMVCAAGWFRPAVLVMVGAVLGVASLVVWLRDEDRRLGWPTIRRPRFILERSLLSGAILFAAPILFLLTLIPVVSWDANTYHLTVPKLYIAHNGFRPIRFNIYSNWPLNIELLFGLAMQFKDYVLAKLVHYGFGMLTLLALYQFTTRLRDKFAGLLAAVLFLGNLVVLFECFVAYVDIALAFFLLMGCWYVTEYARKPEGGGVWLLLAGISGGIMSGVKFSAPLATVCLMVFLLLSVVPRSGSGRRPGGELAIFFVLPCILLAAPWWIKSWLYTGNPVYPLMHGIFGGPDWSTKLGEQLRVWHLSIGMGRGPVDYLLLPLRVILCGDISYERFDGAVSYFWIIWLPVAITRGRRDPLVRNLLLTVLVYFGFWSITSQQMRFLIPVLPLLSVAAAVSLSDVVRGVRRDKHRKRLAGLVAVVAVTSLIGSAAQGLWMVSGFAEEDRTIADQVTGFGPEPVFDFINEKLPTDARIMMLNTNHGFFCDRSFIADSTFEASQFDELLRRAPGMQGLLELLAELGVTHILWHDSDWGIDYPAALFALFEDQSLTRLVYRSPDALDRVYEIVKPPAPRRGPRAQGGGGTALIKNANDPTPKNRSSASLMRQSPPRAGRSGKNRG